VENHLVLAAAFESNNMSSVHCALLNGFGPALVPLAYVASDIERGDLLQIELNQSLWTHKLYVFARKSSEFARHIGQYMLELFKGDSQPAHVGA
jgi:hypothetical protein